VRSAALEPVRAAPATRRSCRHCGGWVVDAAGVCADCAAPVLRLDSAADGVDVRVTGPGEPADKIDARRHVDLYKLLDELPPGSVRSARGRRRAPRVPFYVARGISEASARALVRRLEAMGLNASCDDESKSFRKARRAKVMHLVVRYLAGFGISLNLASAWIRLLPRHWGLVGFLVGIGGVCVSVHALVAFRSRQPLASPPARAVEPHDAESRIAAVIPRLASRSDRRLLAHLLERRSEIARISQHALATPLAERAAQAAEGLAALDVRRDYGAAVLADAAGAIVELRREERTRVVLRADLLRAASRLDDLSLALVRAGASGSGDEAARLEQEIHDLALAVEAEEELGALLKGPR
jgi:hypothetical protein